MMPVEVGAVVILNVLRSALITTGVVGLPASGNTVLTNDHRLSTKADPIAGYESSGSYFMIRYSSSG